MEESPGGGTKRAMKRVVTEQWEHHRQANRPKRKMLTGIEEELIDYNLQTTDWQCWSNKKASNQASTFPLQSLTALLCPQCWRSREEIHPQSPNLSTFLKPPSIPNAPHSHADGFQCGTDGAILGSLLTELQLLKCLFTVMSHRLRNYFQ